MGITTRRWPGGSCRTSSARWRTCGWSTAAGRPCGGGYRSWPQECGWWQVSPAGGLRGGAGGRQAPDRRLDRGEPAQGRDLLGVGSLAGAWDLEDEGHSVEPRLVQEGAKAVVADLPGADVGMPVAVGAQAGDRVVAVDDVDVLQAHYLVQLVDGLAHGFRAALVVARRERVARVEAHADTLVLQLRHHHRDLLEPRADASAEARVVLDEQASMFWICALEHLLQVRGDGRQRLLESGSLVRAGVEDHAADPQLIGRPQVASKRAFGALPQCRVVAREVDQVDGVKVEGRTAVSVGRLLERRD